MNQPSERTALVRLEQVAVSIGRTGRRLPLVRDASLTVGRGEIVCLVGESGSGKSVTARTIMGLMQLEPGVEVSGSLRYDDEELVGARANRFAELRGRDLAMVFQEPLNSLDPVFGVESQLSEALRRRERLGRAAERDRLRELLTAVGITDTARVLSSHPHQLSGGMCQRVMIAQALAARPRLLIADEPTTALDVTIQAQILELIDRLRTETEMSVLLVTHDLGVAADLADRIAVMYAGRVVEEAAPADLFAEPRHPYAAGLLACIPTLTGNRPAVLPAIPGSVPDPSRLPSGCAFHPRCPRSDDRCAAEDPPLVTAGTPPAADDGGRSVACWHAGAPTDIEITSREADR